MFYPKIPKCFCSISPKIRKFYYFLLPPYPISPLFRTFANSIFPNLERANNFLYHHPQREGQQPEEHQFADSEEQVGGHHRPIGIG